jgi:hypothetical protein
MKQRLPEGSSAEDAASLTNNLDCYWIVTGLLLDCYWIVTGLLLDCYWIVTGLLLDHIGVRASNQVNFMHYS